MKKILALAGTALLAATLSLPVAAPATAQGISFGWSVGPGFMRYDDDYRPFVRPSPRYRSGISINIDSGDFRGSSSWARHVDRCEDRYRSYSAVTDMYLGYDGDYHRCRL